MLVGLLFPDIDSRLLVIPEVVQVAYSPIMDAAPASVSIDAVALFNRGTGEPSPAVFLSFPALPADVRMALHAAFQNAVAESQVFMRIVLKRECTMRYVPQPSTRYLATARRIDISARAKEGEWLLSLYITNDALRLIVQRGSLPCSSHQIEQEILRFFQNPSWMIPSLRLIITSLPAQECALLFNRLQRRGLLTPYQILLITHAFPELSGMIKNMISSNIVHDVIELKKKERALKLTRRDIAGGIYSIEEAIYFALRDPSRIGYSRFLERFQRLVTSAIHAGLLTRQTFPQWLAEMAADGLLYQTIARTDERTIAHAVSHETAQCFEILDGRLTEAKIRSIRERATANERYDEVTAARAAMILQYRALKAARQSTDPERFALLCANMTSADAHTRLLLSTGWFVLSTALKGVARGVQERVVKNLPPPAAMLVEDVLKGIVNPNILHDEMQIQHAKRVCVRALLGLYENGEIELAL